MKPSEVVLTGVPLCGTMRKAEIEAAAAIIVRACQVKEDRWQALTLQQILDVSRKDFVAKREPFCSWLINPFLRPDFSGLVDGGWARFVGQALELTDKGITALDRWVLKDVSEE